MVTIYEIGVGGYWTGNTQEIRLQDPAPISWTRSEVPVLSSGEYAKWIGGSWVVTTTPPPAEYKGRKTTPKKMAKDRLTEINAASDNLLNDIRSGYPEFETDTWDQQKAEAEAYLADNTASIPLVQSIADSRGVPVDVLCQKIVEKATAYAQTAGTIIGDRQKLEDQIEAILANTSLTDDEKIDQIGVIR